MTHCSPDHITEHLLSLRSGRPGDPEVVDHLVGCGDCRGIADVLETIGGKWSKGRRHGCLSFEELYEFHFGALRESARSAVKSALAECAHCREYNELFVGLPTVDEVEASAPVAVPDGLLERVFTAVAVHAGELTRESLLSRLGDGARAFLESVRRSADAFVVLVNSAAAHLVKVARLEPEEDRELAFAYDSTGLIEESVPDAIAHLPRIRVAQGWLCLALSQEPSSTVDVSLIDGAGREVAQARPNNIGVVMFRDVAPGTYGLRIRPVGSA